MAPYSPFACMTIMLAKITHLMDGAKNRLSRCGNWQLIKNTFYSYCYVSISCIQWVLLCFLPFLSLLKNINHSQKKNVLKYLFLYWSVLMLIAFRRLLHLSTRDPHLLPFHSFQKLFFNMQYLYKGDNINHDIIGNHRYLQSYLNC